MTKIRKEPAGAEKEKIKAVSSKMTKLPQLRNKQVKLHSPARTQQINVQTSTLATPFSTNSTFKFTSTPMNNGGHPTTNGKLSLNKFTSRLALSPILCNINEGDENTRQKGIISVDAPKENLPKTHTKGSKVNNENLVPDTKPTIRTRRKSVGVRRIAPVLENAKTLLVNKENTESRSSRLRVRLCKMDSSVELLSSDCESSERKANKIQKPESNLEFEKSRTFVFSDSSVSPVRRTRHQKTAEKAQSDSEKTNYMMKRLQSDWSSTTLGEEIPNTSLIKKPVTTAKSSERIEVSQYRQNNCSNLRVRLRRSRIDSIAVNPKPHKPCYDNSLIKNLISDWTSTTFEETPAKNQTPKDNQIRRKEVNKRRLTPLVEMSLEDTIMPIETTTSKVASSTKSNRDEEEYSSSAEFQSDDEANNHHNRSKRAPTWKELLNKTSEPPDVVSKKLMPVVKIQNSLEPKSGPNLGRLVERTQRIDNIETDADKENCYQESIVIAVEKSPTVNKKIKEPSGKKKNDDTGVEVLNNLPLEVINQDSAQNVGVSKETIVPSLPKNDHSQKTNMDNNTNKSHRCDETAKDETIDLRCPVKFFHSRLENTVSEAKPTDNHKSRRSSRRKKQETIYDFLSQSSESNSPVDEVIQKMIKTGKVTVAKHKKGSGKNIIPRKRPPRKKKTTITEEIPPKPTKKPVAAKPPVREKIQDNIQHDDGLHFDDDFHFDDGENEIPEEEQEQVRDQRGFSSLARSAMIKQAGRIQKPSQQRRPITDKKKLLEMALKFVTQSTPVRMTPKPIGSPQYSPMPGNKSPWRVDDDKLPNLFYLGRNSDNLPSFSSDYIPMTPSKNKSKSLSSFSSNDSNGENTAPPGAKIVTNEANMQALTNTRKALTYRSPLKAINIIEVLNLPPLALHSYGKNSNDENSSKNKLQEISRISTNKSASNILKNISNHSPNKNNSNNSSNHSKSDVSNENAENQFENIENQISKQSRSDNNTSKNKLQEISHSSTIKSVSNKRKTVSNNNSINNSNHNLNHSMNDGSYENANNQLEETQNQKSKSDSSNNNVTNLFGFEEMIDDESNSSNTIVDKTILPNKDALKERLQRLKQLRPREPVVIPSKTKHIAPVFDAAPKQKTLKQMLCSTMIDDQYHRDKGNHSFNETEDLSNLFKDPDPETTFNDSNPRRTYNRPFKRKRKMLSKYATMLDSDISEDDEEAIERPVKNYKAKPKKRPVNNPELKKFVNEFNEMCKEVSQYELVVE